MYKNNLTFNKFTIKTTPQINQTPENQTEHFVATGCLATGSQNGIFKTSPLDSCVAVIAYDKRLKLPGWRGAHSYFDALMITINFVEIPKGLNNNSRMRSVRRSCE